MNVGKRIITEEQIQAAQDLGACAPAIQWLRRKPRTLGALVRYHPNWAFWVVLGFITNNFSKLPIDSALWLWDKVLIRVDDEVYRVQLILEYEYVVFHSPYYNRRIAESFDRRIQREGF